MRQRLLFILLLLLPLSYTHALLVGTSSQNPPFSSLADQKGNFYGFDIDIMEEVCKRIKLPCSYTPVVFNEIFNNLKTDKIDLAIAAIIITPELRQDFLYSIPYLASTAQFITQKKSPINQPGDIKNKTIGVRQGTPFKQLALKIYDNQINVMEMAEINDLYSGLTNNTIDIVLTNAAAALYWYSNNSDLYKLIGAQIPAGEGYGIIANKGQDKLIMQINQALLHMEADGTYLQIYTRYFNT